MKKIIAVSIFILFFSCVFAIETHSKPNKTVFPKNVINIQWKWYLHPELNIKFKLPTDWVVQQRFNWIIAKSPDGEVELHFWGTTNPELAIELDRQKDRLFEAISYNNDRRKTIQKKLIRWTETANAIRGKINLGVVIATLLSPNESYSQAYIWCQSAKLTKWEGIMRIILKSFSAR